jgi:hypothetical protein
LHLPTIPCVACRDPAPPHHVRTRSSIVLFFLVLVSVSVSVVIVSVSVSVVIVTVARTLLRGQVIFKVIILRPGNFQGRLVCSVRQFVGFNLVLASFSLAPPVTG